MAGRLVSVENTLMNETQDKKMTFSLAFGVHEHGDNLFSAKIMKLRSDGKVTEWKHGNGTLLGHATAIASSLLDAYAVCAHEVPAEQFYNDVTVI